MIVHLDFETQSVVDIKRCGAGRYATDPSTRILMGAYAVGDGPVKLWFGDKYPLEFDKFIADGAVFAAHNAFFEYAIWKYVWKREPPKFICTKALANACGLPGSLGRAAKSLLLDHQKDIEGQRLINAFCKPQKDGTFRDLSDYPEDKRAFGGYCKKDVEVEREIYKKLPLFKPEEEELFQLTLKINCRGLKIDQELALRAVEMAEILMDDCQERVKELTRGKIHSIRQTVRLKEYLNEKYGLELSGVGSDVIEEAIVNLDPSSIAYELLLLRLEYGRSSVAKFVRALNSVCKDGRIRDYLVHHGAQTGRWSSQAIQLQNLPRGGAIDAQKCIETLCCGEETDPIWFKTAYKHPMSALSECVRGLIIAERGKKLLVADYNAIEARVLMWLVGQKDAVAAFSQGRDIYVDMARTIYNDRSLTKKDKEARQLGKQAVLGCGYQMGPQRFQGTCAGYGMDISEELAEKAVFSYRDTYKKVPMFWNELGFAAHDAVRCQDRGHAGPITFLSTGTFLFCRLPSGRCLRYYQPALEDIETKFGMRTQLCYFTQDSQSNNFKKVYTYGGKLCENVVQAIARDIMAYAMLKLESQGFPVVLSIHDEIVCETNPRCSLEHMLKIMCELPSWASGCPITAEGWEGKRYRK